MSGTLVDFIAIDCASTPQGLKLRIDMCNGFSVILKELAAREVARLAQRQVDYSRCSTPHMAVLHSTQLCSTPGTAMLHSTQLCSTPHSYAPLHTAMLHSTQLCSTPHSYAPLQAQLCSTPHSYAPLQALLCSTPQTAMLHSRHSYAP